MGKPKVKRNFFQRLFGLCATNPPADAGCWVFEGGKAIVDLARATELSARNGAIRLEGMGMPQRVLLFRGVDDRYHALRNKCAHMGRRLDPAPGFDQVQCCSLGGSSYDYDGKILSGLAKESVPAFPVTEEGGKLTIALG